MHSAQQVNKNARPDRNPERLVEAISGKRRDKEAYS